MFYLPFLPSPHKGKNERKEKLQFKIFLSTTKVHKGNSCCSCWFVFYSLWFGSMFVEEKELEEQFEKKKSEREL